MVPPTTVGNLTPSRRVRLRAPGVSGGAGSDGNRMRTPASILVVTDHGEGIADCLGKVLGLAREYGARIELFLCEAEQAYELAHQYDREGVEKARAECVSAALAYLSDLRAALDPQGVEVSVGFACGAQRSLLVVPGPVMAGVGFVAASRACP